MKRTNGSARLPARQQAERDASIIADRARGLAWQTIADRHGLSKRQCQNVWAARGDEERFIQSSTHELQDEIDYLEAMIDELAKLGESTQNDSVRLGTINARINAQNRRIDLKRAAGILPWDLRHIKHEVDFGTLVRAIFDVLERHQTPHAVYADLKRAIPDPRLEGQPELDSGGARGSEDLSAHDPMAPPSSEPGPC